MCGRFAFFSPAEAIAAAFGVSAPSWYEPRYNVAPTQQVMALVAGESGNREWQALRWGLVPFWAKDAAIGNRMINARAETIAEKPAYRQSFSRRRCVVATSGFFEWQRLDGARVPWFICRADKQPFGMAAIWDSWDKHPGGPLKSCSIVTVPANSFMSAIHHRMPVPLERDSIDDWLATDADPRQLASRLMLPSKMELQAWQVSRKVNSPVNDSPELVERVSV